MRMKSSKVMICFWADSGDFLSAIYFSLVNSLKLILGFGLTAPHLTGFLLKLFVKIIEAPLLGSLIVYLMKKENRMVEVCCVDVLWVFFFFF